MDPTNSKDHINGAPVPVFLGLNSYGKPIPQPAVNPVEQPVVQPEIAQPIVVNQVVAVNTQASSYTPYATVCPYCNKKVTTVPVKQFNFCTCSLNSFIFIISYAVIKAG